MNWNITYYNRQVLEDIANLPAGIGGRYIAITQRMTEIGPNIGLPHTQAMGNGLYEIRLKNREGIARVFYCTMKDKEIVMLHSFIKKTQKTPPKELKIAFKRLKEIKNHD